MSNACVVCGSSAPIISASATHGVLELCYGHERVCHEHLSDPCEECDQ